MTALFAYLGQARGASLIRRLEAYGFGEMVCRGELPPRRKPWAFDNGAFKDWTSGKPFDADRYQRDLDKLWSEPSLRPDFLAVPDRVAEGMASYEFSESWRPRLEPMGIPLYLVVQDGMTAESLPAETLRRYAGLFVGGSLDWKLRTSRDWVRHAHGLGLKCHIGRMGTENRVRAAIRWGADSIDSALPLWAEANLQRFLRGFQPTGQGELLEGCA